MFGKTWVFGSLFAAITLITTAASPARAEDHRWSLGRPQWQPPAHAGWANNNRERDWRGNSAWGHERWRQRDNDQRWDHRSDQRRSERERWERERRHEWWRRHHDRRWWD